ncbi:AAA family ATPase [Roseixanthobacter glucoisosaccharinicivorans]|uniref:AAA family ATPase n=1 Tax=Roseixanthobacter glucoisosaccharinicivorans TaxID=3119923 RepID=UPI0037287B71
MRLQRLDLTRYGAFTDRSIDFGARREGQGDLHIIYGPNEAGKSTTLAAFLDLLFGIGVQSPFNFLHSYPTMRIGGLLEIGGATRAFTRIKRPQNSLLDADDRPIAESLIRGELGGIDRDAYRTMFSLDDETLEKGGESILASKGDLGELLFSASAGLADLSRRLLDLKGEAHRFYKYHARSGDLSDLKARLAQLKLEREQTDTLASEHARLTEVRDRAAAQYEAAIAQRTRLQGRMEEIQRQLAALPRLAAWRECRARLAPLAGLPDAPSAWSDELPELQREEIELAVQVQGAAAAIDRLTTEADGIVVDTGALELADRVARLADLRARHVTAEKDIPERRMQMREADTTIAHLLARMDRDGEGDPHRLSLKAATVGRLRELIEARSGIDAAIRGAADELAEAQRRLADAEAKVQAAGADPGRAAQAASSAGQERAIHGLAATLTAVRAGDPRARLRPAERACGMAQASLAERMRALAPWQGEPDHLLAMRCPSTETIQAWKAQRSESERALARHLADIERLTGEILRLEAACAAVTDLTGVVTDQEAAAIRSAREQAWAVHRRDLAPASADAFEALLRREDILAASRLGHMSDLAKLHQSRQALAVTEAELKRAVALKDAAAARLQAQDGAVCDVVRAMAPDLAETLALPDLEPWLARRAAALEAHAALRVAARDLAEVRADFADAEHRLRAALEAAGQTPAPDAAFDTLLAQAQEAVDHIAGMRALQEALDDRRGEMAARARVAAQAAEAERAWTAAWRAACETCWLGERGEMPALGSVREILAAVAELEPALEKQAGLRDRIAKMEKDQAQFRAEVRALAEALSLDAGTMPVLDLAQRVVDTVQAAAAERDRRGKLRAQLEEAHARRRALAEAEAIHAQRKAQMTGVFGVAALAEVAAALSDIARRAELRQQAQEAARDVRDALRLDDMEQAERVLDAADRPALEAELLELKARFEDHDRRCHALFAERSAAVDQVEAIGGDSIVAEIEGRRRTLLLEIEEGAMRYLHLRAGTTATELALRAYRERHRSSMMARASDAFRTISRGAYAGLATQPAKDGETLIAQAAGGGSKAADTLSKGTRFQLYLALRVAGYHEFARARSPVPFVADDIMETFDDFRAEEAFRLFSEMAQVGQVIYLTHHRHLCDLARKVCPGVRIHDLSRTDAGDARLIAESPAAS